LRRQSSHQIGQMIWSTAQQATPFQGGFLCVGWPLQRKPVQASLGASSGNDCTYLPTATTGKLASLDPAVLVTPPDGLEVGYMPIVTRQEAK
jgi:hypothetical protein